METLFYRYNPWWEGKLTLEGIIERSKPLSIMRRNLQTKQIVLLTGLRRVGKTTLLKLFIKSLIERENIDAKHIFYISLDDYLLTKKSIIEIVDEFRSINKISFKEKVYLFFDEITYKKDFELQLKNLYDSQEVKIYASSSSASVLRSRKPYLTGRHVTLEIMPLDFQEYLIFKQINIQKSDQHLVASHFEGFLFTGGLPEYVLHGDIEYLKELVDDIIYKDIASFYKIRKPQILKDYFVLLMERAGKVVSINKIAHILKISPDTAKRYLKMFADTYLIYLVSRHGKTNDNILAPKKIYAADLGVRCIFTGNRDKGSLFENYIYLKIKDENPKYLYQDGTEIDYLTEDKTLIEVKYGKDLNEIQEKLFKKFKADKKVIIKSNYDLEKYLEKEY